MNAPLHPIRLAVLLLVYLQVGPIWGQTTRQLDSLAHRLRSHVFDTNYVDTQNRYGWQLLQQSAFGRADSIFRQAESLSRRLGYPTGLHQRFYNQGLSLYYQDQPASAIRFVQQALDLEKADSARIPMQYRPMTRTLMGVLLFATHDYNRSLNTYLAAIKLAEQHRITYRITPAYLGVGNVLKVMNKPLQALTYYRKALEASYHEPEPRMRVLAENHLGDALSESKKPDYRLALQHYLNALPIAERNGAHGPLSDVLTNIGRVHLALQHYQTALRYLKRSENVCRKDSLRDQLGAVFWITGQAHLALKQYPLAETNLLQSLALAQEIGNADEVRKRTQTLADFYAKTGKYSLAYAYEHQTALLNDSLFSDQAARHTQELTTRFETAQKESQLKLLRAETERSHLRSNALLAGAVLIILLIGATAAWLLNRARFRRLKEAQALRKRIAQDLHDEVGSTLSSISLLSGHTDKLLTQSRPGVDTSEKAQQMVQRIYADARQILDSIDEIIWTINPGNDSLQRVILRLQEYAQPLMELKNIRFQFENDPNLALTPVSMEVRRNLFLIAKEAINNLVKYSEATQATVRFKQQGTQLVIEVEDNGRGFDPQQPSERSGQSGMRARAEAMSGSLRIDSTPQTGTALRLVVPLG